MRSALILAYSKMMRMSVWLAGLLIVVFILPSLVHLAVWKGVDRPQSWRHATWSSAGILPATPEKSDAGIYVLSARTGGLKGAFSTHSWIVLKAPGKTNYDRYDVVGWGTPVRKNAYDADGHWYSNRPEINHKITGQKAADIIPKIEQAVANYPWNQRGDYVTWPGPNSNTFVASILRDIPDLAVSTPHTAVGRDFPAGGKWFGRHPNGSWFATLGGYLGVVIGGETGFEINFLGLVAGFNPFAGEILIPSFGGFKI